MRAGRGRRTGRHAPPDPARADLRAGGLRARSRACVRPPPLLVNGTGATPSKFAAAPVPPRCSSYDAAAPKYALSYLSITDQLRHCTASPGTCPRTCPAPASCRCAVAAERICGAERHAAIRADVGHRVVGAAVRHVRVERAGRRCRPMMSAPAARDRSSCTGARTRGVPKPLFSPTNAWRPNSRPPAEIAAAHVEAAFEREHRLVAAAEILGAAQPPARRQLARHARHPHEVVACRVRVRHVFDARIDDPV